MSSDITGWVMAGFIAVLFLVPLALGIIGIQRLYSGRPIEKRYAGSGGILGGALSGMDAAFFPSSHDAGIERDRQTKRTAPAPAPGDPFWAIETERIVIDVD